MLVVVCNPADLNLADVKATAARLDLDAVGSPYVPPGQVFLIDTSYLYPWRS